jgi:hypothetical protein
MSPPTLTIDGRKFRVIPEADYRMMAKAMQQQRAREAEDEADVRLARRVLRNKADRIVPYAEARKRLGLA